MATKEEGIKSLKKVAEVLGHSPSRREYEKNPHRTVDEHALRNLFGNFNRAKKAAGLQYATYGKAQHTKAEFMKNLKYIAAELGHVPTRAEYDKHPARIVASRTAEKHFGSWVNLCYESGYATESMQYAHHSDQYYKNTQEILLRDLYKEMIRHPECSTWKVITKYAPHSILTYYKYLGHIPEINRIMEMRYGIVFQYAKKRIVNWNKKTIEEEFRRVESIVKRTPRMADMNQYSQYKNIRLGIEKIYGTYTKFVLKMGRIPWNQKKTKDTMERDKRICIKALRKVVREQDITSWKSEDYYKNCHVTFYRIQHLFYGIANWFIASKIPASKIPKKFQDKRNIIYATKKEIIAAIQKMTHQLGHFPSMKEYKENQGNLASLSYIYRHVGSWKQVKTQAGF